MRNRFVIAAAGLVAAGLLSAAAAPAVSSQEVAGHGNIAFGIVKMSGAEEVSPTGQVGVGDVDGKGKFGYLAFDSTLCYFITQRKLDPVVAAHIHGPAPRGANASIVIGLTAPVDGFAADCITAVPDSTPNTPAVLTESELAAIIADPSQFYANTHTTVFPAGAIRGQLK
jgi:hypothetical protein